MVTFALCIRVIEKAIKQENEMCKRYKKVLFSHTERQGVGMLWINTRWMRLL